MQKCAVVRAEGKAPRRALLTVCGDGFAVQGWASLKCTVSDTGRCCFGWRWDTVGGSSAASSDRSVSIARFMCSYAGSELSAWAAPAEIPFSPQLLAVKHTGKRKGRQGGNLNKLIFQKKNAWIAIELIIAELWSTSELCDVFYTRGHFVAYRSIPAPCSSSGDRRAQLQLWAGVEEDTEVPARQPPQHTHTQHKSSEVWIASSRGGALEGKSLGPSTCSLPSCLLRAGVSESPPGQQPSLCGPCSGGAGREQRQGDSVPLAWRQTRGSNQGLKGTCISQFRARSWVLRWAQEHIFECLVPTVPHPVRLPVELGACHAELAPSHCLEGLVLWVGSSRMVGMELIALCNSFRGVSNPEAPRWGVLQQSVSPREVWSVSKAAVGSGTGVPCGAAGQSSVPVQHGQAGGRSRRGRGSWHRREDMADRGVKGLGSWACLGCLLQRSRSQVPGERSRTSRLAAPLPSVLQRRVKPSLSHQPLRLSVISWRISLVKKQQL